MHGPVLRRNYYAKLLFVFGDTSALLELGSTLVACRPFLSMYIEPLSRQMAVCSFDGAIRLTALDKKFWNVISIRGPQQQRASLPFANSVHYFCFDDIEDQDSTIFRSPRAEDVAAIFAAIGGMGSVPLLIHCQQGISRSAAIALAWIYGHLPDAPDRVAHAVNLLLQLRPEAKPNRLVLTFGLAHFTTPAEADRLARWILADPRFTMNPYLEI